MPYPDSVQRIIELVGETEAINFIRKHGGITLYFKSCDNDKGDRTWDILQKHFKGEILFIPRCYKLMLKNRNASIKADRHRGMSINQLAQKYKLTDRQIFNIVGHDSDTKTNDIFTEVFQVNSDADR